MLSRRYFLLGAASLASIPARDECARAAAGSPAPGAKPNAALAKPIAVEERRARIAKVQHLMGQQQIAALLLEPGATLEYFTGVRWFASERTTAAMIPAQGEVMLVTPHFEEPSVRETLQVGGQVRTWEEHESPFELIVKCLRDAKIPSGKIAFDPMTRLFIITGVRHSGGNAYEIVPGDSLVRACRLIKSPAELALMQMANNITLEALRVAHAKTAAGMTQRDLGALVEQTTREMGAAPEFSIALLNEASSFPHGSVKTETVHEGSVILMDCGCSVQGYQSDISRTWVYGAASVKQRKVWETVKRGQEVALEAARLNAPVGAIDDAVRRFYAAQGWGPGYRLPGLPHRTGHGIGSEVHEPPYLVHGDATLLEAGMCFSDEPGIYLPGEFGVRLEDCWTMTDSGPKPFTPLARSLDQPI
jgi:Xaa-Pro dipeptidase